MLAYAGGEVGKTSALITGWNNGAAGSSPVTRKIRA